MISADHSFYRLDQQPYQIEDGISGVNFILISGISDFNIWTCQEFSGWGANTTCMNRDLEKIPQDHCYFYYTADFNEFPLRC